MLGKIIVEQPTNSSHWSCNRTDDTLLFSHKASMDFDGDSFVDLCNSSQVQRSFGAHKGGIDCAGFDMEADGLTVSG